MRAPCPRAPARDLPARACADSRADDDTRRARRRSAATHRRTRSRQRLLRRDEPLELASLDEVVEEARMRLEAAVLHALHERLELVPLRRGEKRDARALDGRVADLHDLLVGQIGDEPD